MQPGINMFLVANKVNKVKKSDKPNSSAFSDFFRKASSREKKKVFSMVTKEAIKKQQAYLQ